MKLPDPEMQPTLSIQEVAKVLGVSRALAYRGAREYVATGGRRGIPTLKLGERRFRCPTAAVLALLADPASSMPPITHRPAGLDPRVTPLRRRRVPAKP